MYEENIKSGEIIWLPKPEELTESLKSLKSKNGDYFRLTPPLKRLRAFLSNIYDLEVNLTNIQTIPDVSHHIKEKDNSEAKPDVAIIYSEILFSFQINKELSLNKQTLINRLCSCKMFHQNVPEIWLKLDVGSFLHDNDKLLTKSNYISLSKFSLGNLVGLNSFVEHFDSSSSLSPYDYKITQIKAKFLHDSQKLILFFVVCKAHLKLKKRNALSHHLHKLIIPYSSFQKILIYDVDKTKKFTALVQMLKPPLLYSVEQNLDEQYVNYLKLHPDISWYRTVDLFDYCPPDMKKEFSMNTVIKLDFEEHDYNRIFQLIYHCSNVDILFTPLSIIQSASINIPISSKNFECYYALRCLFSHSFIIQDQLICNSNFEEMKIYLKEKCAENEEALTTALYEIYTSIDQGHVILFNEAIKILYKKFSNKNSRSNSPNQTANFVEFEEKESLSIKKALFLPTHIRFLPPQLALKSRAMRNCNPEFSIRVSIRDINLEKLNFTLSLGFGPNRAENEKKFFIKYIKDPLIKGIRIGHRLYKYVASSTSQLRAHGLWFYAKDDKDKIADQIRQSLGDMDRIKIVPKKMARMGQTFSQAIGYIKVPQDLTNVKSPDKDITGGIKIYLSEDDTLKKKKHGKFLNTKNFNEDLATIQSSSDEEDINTKDLNEDLTIYKYSEEIKYKDSINQNIKNSLDVATSKSKDFDNEDENDEPYTFSDGIGQISPELIEMVYKELNLEKEKPSAMQIRYAGCKGMLVVNPKLKGKQIIFRESMKKFDSDNDSLEILKYSEKRCAYLNRPLITILEQLGIAKEVFLRLQREMIQNNVKSMFYEKYASNFLNKNALLHINYLDMHNCGIKLTEDPLFLSMIFAIFVKQIELLKEKARIEIPANLGRSMFGVLDETFTLEYGEVFVQYTDWDTNELKILTGIVIVTKNPCMHPGDVRKFNAIDVEELHHIKDCIVFPAKGHRPHPDEMAGSDLDGDEYHVMWHEDFIFERDNENPMHFATRKDLSKEIDRPITVEDEMNHLTDYILNDHVGIIANAHLAHADQEKRGIFSEKCINLAKKYSIALDFPKTGKSVKRDRTEIVHSYPDFMQKLNEKNTYLSKNALGCLYRNCKRLDFSLSNTYVNIKFELDEDLIIDSPEKYQKSAILTLQKYSEKVEKFIRNYSLQNEGEFLSGAILQKPKFYQDRHDFDNLMSLIEFEIRHLFQNLETHFFKEFGGKPNDRSYTQEMFQKASAWYRISYAQKENRERYFLGMPWAISDILVEMKLRKKNLINSPDKMIKTYKSKIEEAIDKKYEPLLCNNVISEINLLYDNRLDILEAAHEILMKWLETLKEFIFIRNFKTIKQTLNKEFDSITILIRECDINYFKYLIESGQIKKVTSPGHYVIETLLGLSKIGSLNNPELPLADVQHELGIFAWITLIKIACSCNIEYLGLVSNDNEKRFIIENKPQNQTETLQLPLFERNNIDFSEKLILEEEKIKSYLLQQTQLKNIELRIKEDKGKKFFVKITMRGSRNSIERLKDIVILDDFYEAVVNEKPLTFKGENIE